MCNSTDSNNGNIYSLTYLFYSFMADIAGIFFGSGLECGTYSQIICAIFFSKNSLFNCMRRNADDFVRTEDGSGITSSHILLPYMNAIGIDFFCNFYIVIDHEWYMIART